ncbi:MAG: ATP-binding cassette domain-containing protein [Ilumatobacteraceae bacterium]
MVLRRQGHGRRRTAPHGGPRHGAHVPAHQEPHQVAGHRERKLGATGQKGEKWWNGLIPGTWKQQEAEIEARADQLLQRFKLDHMRDEYAGALSGGQRKLLEMARALMTDPTLVMLDEPMAGVNPALKQSLNAHVKGLRDEGMTVLFVEHDMDMVHDISDWVIVMAEGRVIAEGTPDDISSNPAVIDAYLGMHQGRSLLEDL